MKARIFNESDIKQIETMGITVEDVLSQIDNFKKGAPYLILNRPGAVNDGIRTVSEDEQRKLNDTYDKYAPKMTLVKFVPASGAASRMFKTLLQFNNEYTEIRKETIESLAKEGDPESKETLIFIEGIRKFAFLNDLKSAMSKDGLDTDALINAGEFKQIIDYLLMEKGLDYSNLPKGLLKFHLYNDGARTPFEEHLVEAVGYAKDENKKCRLHFTVSPEHMERFKALLQQVTPYYEKRFEIKINVDFSIQEKSTNTVAVDMDNKPFRLNNETLLFRPGGHGALLKNLNRIKGDIVYIKNIDNVVPDRLKPQTIVWKKVLGGILIQIQKRIFNYIKKLKTHPPNRDILNEALAFAKTELCLNLLPNQTSALEKQTRDVVLKTLNRPLRVCGMVKNVGEPGGGPFWVEGRRGGISLQIVESAQVDPASEKQQKVWASATHFNPVDLVCGLRDWQGKPFDLKRYVDNRAVFISQKSKGGRNLKALELPGLWNGAMAGWNTIFVEVPLITFNPVKTVNDLLRKEHQPDESQGSIRE
jgi:hypothetical protein